MQTLWTIIAVAAALAIIGGVVLLIDGELRAHRLRQIQRRLEEASRTTPRLSSFGVDVDRQLRNRSERWD